MSARAVSVDELTGGGPIVVFAPTLADACLGCGALLAACFAHRGALVVTTLAATAPAWVAGIARPRTALPDRIRAGSPAGESRPEPTRASSRRPAGAAAPGPDLVAPLEALGATASSVRALSPDGVLAANDRERPDRTAEGLADLCRALGVRSVFLPSTPHRSTRHAEVVEAAASRVRGTRDEIRAWRYPAGAPAATDGWTAGRERLVRMLDATPWHAPKREALLRMHAAGFELPDLACLRGSPEDRAGTLAALPERYLREADAP